MAKKYCYLFTEGNATMRELLGGKGANLAEMTNIGLPVPQGFTITTEACTQYYEDGRTINPDIMAEINEYIGKMEEITGKKFGDKENPLLVSVRSGARASMPGMMDTILNLGLNEDVVEVIAKKSGNARWAWDCYRRFIQMYSDVVMEVGKKYFEELIDKMKEEKGVTFDVELTADDLKELASQFKAEYKEKITNKIHELLEDSQIDESRIAQEVTVFADKVCVDEELVRLDSHIKAMREDLLKGGTVGRRLDFIAQEMNREANTTLSKTSDPEISDHAIMLKTDIEKVREQIQNIE